MLRENLVNTMKKTSYFLLVMFFFIENGIIFPQSFEYISPKNNSVLVSLKTNIILKSNEKIDKSSLLQDEFIVRGSKSGEHAGVIKLSDNNETVLFLPTVPFLANESVTVNVSQGIKTISRNSLPAVTIHFKTTPLKHPVYLNTDSLPENGIIKSMRKTSATYKLTKDNSITDSLPPDFPPITVDSSNNPAGGKIFIANGTPSFPPSGPIGNYIMILNNDGSVLKYRKTNSANPADFKVQYNGELSYADLIDFIDGAFYDVRWIVLDTTLTPIDTVHCGNGYFTDMHEFRLSA